jgi:transposase
MAHGINANLVHKWRAQALKRQDIAATMNAATFIPVPMLAQSSSTASSELRIELRRGAVTVTVCWPMSTAIECAAWVREVLR